MVNQNQELESSVEDGENLVDTIISECLKDPEFQSTFKEHWHGRIPYKSKNLEVIAEPFRVCKISNFIKNEKFIEDLKHDLSQVNTNRNKMDLYQFRQTKDFQSINKKNVSLLRKSFKVVLSSWLKQNTNIDLHENISMSSSLYYDTDYLLCHDDNNEDRRIAFILYLTKDWNVDDGGQLALLDTDEHGQPNKIVKLLNPDYNSLVFFEVTHNSYHQVLEVLSPEKCRWSVNGWFHGPIEVKKKPDRPIPEIHFEALTIDNTIAQFWINKPYLSRSTGTAVNKCFEVKSNIFLSDFLNTSVYNVLSKQVQSDNVKWNLVGPPDVRSYQIAKNDSLPLIFQYFLRFLKSEEFLILLNWYTELDIVPKKGLKPKISIELQKWTNGSYSLITDERICDTVHEEYLRSPLPTNSPFSKNEEEIDDKSESDNDSDVVEYCSINSNSSDEEMYMDENSDEDNSICQPSCSSTSTQHLDIHEDIFASSSSKMTDHKQQTNSMLVSKINNQNSCKRTHENDNSQHSSVTKKRKDEVTEENLKKKECSTTKEQLIQEAEEYKSKKNNSELVTSFKAEKEKEDEEKIDEQDFEKQLRMYETLNYMIANKKVVLPFKAQFKDMLNIPKKKLFDLLHNVKLRYEDVLIPRNSSGKIVSEKSRKNASFMNTLVKESTEQLELQLSEEWKSFEEGLDKIAKKFQMIEEGKIDQENDTDEEYTIETEDLIEKKFSKETKDVCEKKIIKLKNQEMPPYMLQLMIQFNVTPNNEKQCILYVDPQMPYDATLIRVPVKSNHLCMVYKEPEICRVHKYINHYNQNTFYNLVCTYWEKDSL